MIYLFTVKLVNEEHRIGVYTGMAISESILLIIDHYLAKALRPGAELLFDYGPSFFGEVKSASGHVG